MTDTTYLQFDGLQNPVALHNAARLLPMIADVFNRCPFHATTTTPRQPFATIRPDGSDHWTLELDTAQGELRRWNAVNVICDLVAEMAWEKLRSDPTLLSLHAAAVEFSGRLVVFPNARRTGKSTLTAALAHLGRSIFTDDYLPVQNDLHRNTTVGLANGIAPRIRLPLPDGFSGEMHDWVARDRGPKNNQYKYLCGATVAPCGDALPLGAMIILDRLDDCAAPALTPITRSDALASLITQNFSRAQRSDAILNMLEGLTQGLPVFRLTYGCGETAARLLDTHPALQSLPAAKGHKQMTDMGEAPLEKVKHTKPVFSAVQHYVQADGLTETKVGSDHFLVDGDGLSIFRLNAGSVAIWNVLSEPSDLREMIEILRAAFQDADATQIAQNCETLMSQLAQAGLIVPARAQVAVR